MLNKCVILLIHVLSDSMGNITFIVILVFCILFIYTNVEETDRFVKHRTLKRDGYKVYDNKQTFSDIINELPKDYVFLDYKYTIKGCTLQTFHRDVTSSQYIFKTKYPVYTYIVYNNKGPTLSVCPKSHLTTPFVFTKPVTIYNNNNHYISILFNCDLVHCGSLNNLGDKREAIQFKIAHKDDIPKLKSLVGINKIQSNKCHNYKIHEYIIRKTSLIFCFIINHCFTSYLQTNQNNLINDLGIYLFGKSFYNK